MIFKGTSSRQSPSTRMSRPWSSNFFRKSEFRNAPDGMSSQAKILYLPGATPELKIAVLICYRCPDYKSWRLRSSGTRAITAPFNGLPFSSDTLPSIGLPFAT